ncbi:MAG: pyrroline-5-carboxylate reductase [Lachnospiraceae bacterium]|nr:pyrroline-5-carboxylate reductase [Lachnospiraceae bacterium]
MRIGLIGCGNMARAIMQGFIETDTFRPDEIIASDKSRDVLDSAADKLGIRTTTNNSELVLESDVIVLAVKPQVLESVITEISDVVAEQKLIISIVAGQSIKRIEEMFDHEIKLVRTMPNTPALVLEGMTAVCCNGHVSNTELEYTCKILGSFGKTEVISESLMDAVVAVSGSSPAYVAMMIEAMADAAVNEGMPRPQAYKFAEQAVIGSAKLLMETGMHPGELKDMVCSPAGTTIEAVRVLEEKGFRSAIMEGMKACANVSKKL